MSNPKRTGEGAGRSGHEAITGAAEIVSQGQRDRHGERRGKGRYEKGRRGRRRGEPTQVPDADFRSYHGRPILNQIVWKAGDIGGYLFLGGLAGASSVLAAGAEYTGRPSLARSLKYTALVAISGSTVALIHDLGRPERFLNMLRVFKPTSPMNMGSWILMGYGPLAGVAAVTAATGWFPRIGRAATIGAGLTGPLVATYTAPLICDTAVPAWHEGYREMPFVFASSAAAAAGGMGLILAPSDQSGPARRTAVGGALTEVAVSTLMERRMGLVGEPYARGRAGVLTRTAKALTLLGAAGAVLGPGNRVVSALSGTALLTGSALTRLGVFHAGVQSAADPKYTVVPQRQRLEERAREQEASEAQKSPVPAG